MSEAKRVALKKTIQGIVVSDKADKTVSVKVERRFAHPLYGKVVTRSKNYAAHDEQNEYRTGDQVEIVSVRPISKTKTWKVARLIERPRGIETTVVETELIGEAAAQAKAEAKAQADAAESTAQVDGVTQAGTVPADSQPGGEA